MKGWHKLGLLTTLYLSQGLPFGFFTQALPVLLRTREVSLPAIGAAHLLSLPWALKFLAAPWMDRAGTGRWGRRRGFILPLQLVAAAACFALAVLDATGELHLLFVGVFTLNLIAAWQDISTDGLAVELLKDRERGLGNAIQVAGYRIGMILGGGVLLIASDRIGWPWTFVCMGGLLLLATAPIAAYREPPNETERTTPLWEGLTDWRRLRGPLPWLGVVALYKFGDAFASGMLRPMLVDHGYAAADIGWILGTLSFTTGLLGALAGGALTTFLGRRRALIGLGAVQSVVLFAYPLLAWKMTTSALYVVSAVEHFTGGMATVALFTAMMEATRPKLAATDYTVQACASVIAGGLASSLSGFSAHAFGYVAHFTAGAVLSCLGVVAAALVGFEQLWSTANKTETPG